MSQARVSGLIVSGADQPGPQASADIVSPAGTYCADDPRSVLRRLGHEVA
jgi:hypothetical protein